MRRTAFLLLLAACSNPRAAEAPAARWEIDEDANLAVPLCPRCSDPVLRKESACPSCGARYRIERKSIDCPECEGGRVTPRCAACEGTGRCSVCDGSGGFEGKPCPECEGRKTCGDCASTPPPRACDNCGGTGTITLE